MLNLFELPFMFLGNLNVNNYHRQTLLVKWNIYTPNLITFVAKIATINHFLSSLLFFSEFVFHPENKNE